MAHQTLTEGVGFRVSAQSPVRGSIVPMKHYGKDRRVTSIMVEVNRRLYMDERTGAKRESFDAIKADIANLLPVIREYRKRAARSINSFWRTIGPPDAAPKHDPAPTNAYLVTIAHLAVSVGC